MEIRNQTNKKRENWDIRMFRILRIPGIVVILTD